MKQKSFEKLQEKLLNGDEETSKLAFFNATKNINGVNYHQFKDILILLYEKKAKKEIVNSLRDKGRKQIELETIFSQVEG